MLVQRKCVACRQLKPTLEMLRVAKINNQFYLDKSGKLGGRGAHICNNINCLTQTINKHLLNKAYKQNVPSQIYEELQSYAKNI